MRVQDASDILHPCDCQMQKSLRGRFCFTGKHATLTVNFNEVVVRKHRLVQAGRSDQQSQRTSLQHHTVISARTKSPATLMKLASKPRKLLREVRVSKAPRALSTRSRF